MEKGVRMNELNTIIIPTKNNQDCIIKTLNILKTYSDKHPSTSQIILSDNASNDETLPQIIHWINQNKDSKFLLITQPRRIDDKKSLLVALETVQTPITIILEPELYTRLHQIKKQVELLRKCELVLPSRLHKDSKTNYKPDFKKKLYRIFNKTRYDDLENQNKTFHTKLILQLMRNTKTENYWEEIIKEHPELRITQTSAHWISK
jgi:glycosyltransferase involved in cell wall biosynthesis